jgi:hypothetical protein
MGAENIVQKGVVFKGPKGEQWRFKLGMMAQASLAKTHGTITRVYDKLSGKRGEDGKLLVKEKEYELNIDGTIKKNEKGEPVEVPADMTECQLEAMIDIVYAGLMRDAEDKGLVFSRNDALRLVDDMGYFAFMDIINGHWTEALPDVEPDPTAGSETK